MFSLARNNIRQGFALARRAFERFALAVPSLGDFSNAPSLKERELPYSILRRNLYCIAVKSRGKIGGKRLASMEIFSQLL